MTPQEALDQILKDLSVSFGDGLAARIISSARSTARVPDDNLDTTHYTGVVQAVCEDARVIGMLGELTVRDKQSLWNKLVS